VSVGVFLCKFVPIFGVSIFYEELFISFEWVLLFLSIMYLYDTSLDVFDLIPS